MTNVTNAKHEQSMKMAAHAHLCTPITLASSGMAVVLMWWFESDLLNDGRFILENRFARGWVSYPEVSPEATCPEDICASSRAVCPEQHSLERLPPRTAPVLRTSDRHGALLAHRAARHAHPPIPRSACVMQQQALPSQWCLPLEANV